MQKQKCFAALAAVIFAGAVISGCAAEKIPDSPEAVHSAAVAHSLVSTGNTCRLGRVFEKAAGGEDITFAYVGGSITEGYSVGARAPECYASLSASEFETAYCTGGTVTCQNNGLSGTPSVLGNLRAGSEVLPSQPDIIFIEFAVNDSNDPLCQSSYESLVRSCLEAPNAPAVILLFICMENGRCCQEQQQEIGAYYDLGMISVRDGIQPELDEGRMLWSDFGADDVHPSKDGHRLIADMIANYFTAAKAK